MALWAEPKWATLPNADYDAIKLFDYDGDHASDFAVLLDGTWTIGTQAASGDRPMTSRRSSGLAPIGRTSASATSTATDATTSSRVPAEPGGSCGSRTVRSSRPAGTGGATSTGKT